MKIADKDTAEQARALYDALLFLRGSDLGHGLNKRMLKLDQDAITRAMRGKTPEDRNTYFESRGVVKAIHDIRSYFDEVEENGKKAMDYLAAYRAKGKDEE